MAFALTGFKCDGVLYAGPTRQRAIQQAHFYITAANTDVDLDIADASGTFWTAAIADATYGSMASAALSKLQLLIPGVSALQSVTSETLASYGRVKAGGSAGANEYVVDITGNLPNISFHSGDAPTSQVLILTWSLADATQLTSYDAGAAIT